MNVFVQYLKLMRKAVDRGWTRKTAPVYVEMHHVVPNSWVKNKMVVALTAKEHFAAHRWLHKAFPEDDKMAAAYFKMCRRYHNLGFTVLANRFEEARKAVSDTYKVVRLREGNPNFGNRWSMTEESKKKIRDSRISMFESEEGKKYRSEISATQVKVAKRLRDEGFTRTLNLVECPHCGKEGKGGNMSRYHFDNCKHKNSGVN